MWSKVTTAQSAGITLCSPTLKNTRMHARTASMHPTFWMNAEHSEQASRKAATCQKTKK
jgi:hypothetical protein